MSDHRSEILADIQEVTQTTRSEIEFVMMEFSGIPGGISVAELGTFLGKICGHLYNLSGTVNALAMILESDTK